MQRLKKNGNLPFSPTNRPDARNVTTNKKTPNLSIPPLLPLPPTAVHTTTLTLTLPHTLECPPTSLSAYPASSPVSLYYTLGWLPYLHALCLLMPCFTRRSDPCVRNCQPHKLTRGKNNCYRSLVKTASPPKCPVSPVIAPPQAHPPPYPVLPPSVDRENFQ